MRIIVDFLDGLTEYFGRMISWLALFMVLMSFTTVVLRYVYGISNVAMIETIVYAFAILLAGSAGWTLLHNEHVRVDIFYGAMSERNKALVDLFGAVFFMFPVLFIIWSKGLPYVSRSWKLRETSNEVAGLDYLYLLKTFILVFAVVLAVQGVSFVLRKVHILIHGTPMQTKFGPQREQA